MTEGLMELHYNAQYALFALLLRKRHGLAADAEVHSRDYPYDTALLFETLREPFQRWFIENQEKRAREESPDDVAQLALHALQEQGIIAEDGTLQGEQN